MFENGINEKILREISVGGKSGALNFYWSTWYDSNMEIFGL